jgi:hypothetical protein
MAAVLKNGDLYTWGRGFEGQTGQTSTTSNAATNANLIGVQLLPKYVADFQRMKKKIKRVACGHLFTICLTDAGEIYSFGEGQCGQLGIGKKQCSKKLLPQLVKEYAQVGQSRVPFVDVVAGWGHTMALTQTGEMFVWGFNQYGQLGLGNMKTEFEPKPLLFEPGFCGKVVKMDAASHYSAALTANNEVFTWGNGRYGKLGHINILGGNQAEDEEPETEVDYTNKLTPTRVNAMTFEGRLPTKLSCSERSMSVFSPTQVTGMFPTSGPVCGQTQLIIEGAGYWPSDDITVRFTPLADEETGIVPDISARAVLGEYLGEGKIRCRTPKMSAPCVVKVELALNGKSYTKDGARFKYYPTPQLQVLSPQYTHMQGGQRILIIGDALHLAVEVTVKFQESPSGPASEGDEPLRCKHDYQAVVLKEIIVPPPKDEDEDEEDEDEDGAPQEEPEPEYDYKVVTTAPAFDEVGVDSFPLRCTVSVSFNGQDFHPVKGMQLTFHDCRLNAVKPTCAPTLVGPTVPELELCGQSFFEAEQLHAYFIFPPKPKELSEEDEAAFTAARTAARDEEVPRVIERPMEEQLVILPARCNGAGVVCVRPPPLQEIKPPPLELDEEGNPLEPELQEGEEPPEPAEVEFSRNIASCTRDEDGEYTVLYNKPISARIVLSFDGGASFVGSPPGNQATDETGLPGVPLPVLPAAPVEPPTPDRPSDEQLDAGLAVLDEEVEMEYANKMTAWRREYAAWIAARAKAIDAADSCTFDYYAPGQCRFDPPCGPMSGGTKVQVIAMAEGEGQDEGKKKKGKKAEEEEEKDEPEWLVPSEFVKLKFVVPPPVVDDKKGKKGKKGKKEEAEPLEPVKIPQFEGEGEVGGVCETREAYLEGVRKAEEEAAAAKELAEAEEAARKAAEAAELGDEEGEEGEEGEEVVDGVVDGEVVDDEAAALLADEMAADEAAVAESVEATEAADGEAGEGGDEGEAAEGGEGEAAEEEAVEEEPKGPKMILYVQSPAMLKEEGEKKEEEAKDAEGDAADAEAAEADASAEGEAAEGEAVVLEVPLVDPVLAEATLALDGESFVSCGESPLSKFVFYADPVITGATPAEGAKKATIELSGQQLVDTGYTDGVQVKLVCMDTVEVLLHGMEEEDVLQPLEEPTAAAEEAEEEAEEAEEAVEAVEGEEEEGEEEEEAHVKVQGTPLVGDIILVGKITKKNTLQFQIPPELELSNFVSAADIIQAEAIAELGEGEPEPLPPALPPRVRFAVMASLNGQQFSEPFKMIEFLTA